MFQTNLKWAIINISTENGTIILIYRYILRIQAPSTSEDAKEKIFDAIPILKYACESIDIDNVDDYEIDGKVQLVCKYLQAHHSKKLNPEAPSQCKCIVINLKKVKINARLHVYDFGGLMFKIL